MSNAPRTVRKSTGRTWETNADEYAAKDNGEDWAFVLLVACSVELDAGHGVNDRWQVDDDKDCAVAESLGKVSAVKFAKRAGTSAKRVTRYLQAAVRAASARSTLLLICRAPLLGPTCAATLTMPASAAKSLAETLCEIARGFPPP
jgi:hypothetical protein